MKWHEMINYKKHLIYYFFSFICTTLPGQTINDNIIIASEKEVYTFKADKKGEIYIEEESSTEYECYKMAETITAAEFYEEQSEITNISIKGIKGTKPQYTTYIQKGIFYSDTKVCYFDLPFSKKGQKAQVFVKKIYHDIHYFSCLYLSKPWYIREKNIKLVVPQWMHIEIFELNTGANITKEVTVDAERGVQIFSYHIRDLKAEKYEENMPDRSYIYPHLIIVPKYATLNGSKRIFFNTTTDLYKWYYDNLLRVKNDSNILSAQAKAITKDCITDDEKIRRLFAWVQENIRYIAFENGIAAFKPDEAQSVLNKKYGDCKGMSNLLRELLKAEGFDARLAWISTSNVASDFSNTSPVANHMICALFRNQQLYFLDPTVKYMPLGEYPQTIQGRQAMIENGSEYIMERVPVSPPSLNTDSTYCELIIENNVLKGKAESYYCGEVKQHIMTLIHSIGKDKLESSLKNFLEHGNFQNKVYHIILSGIKPGDDKVLLQFDEELGSRIQTSGNELYINLGPDNDFYTAVDTAKRENDIMFPYKIHRVYRSTLTVPHGYRVEKLPGDFKIENNRYLFSISYKEEENKVIYQKEMTIFDPWLKKDLFQEWNNSLNLLKKSSAEQIVLIKH